MTLKLKELDKNDLVLVISPSEKIATTTITVLDYVLKKKKDMCVYVTISKPANVILSNLKKKKIPTEGIFFIDCISPIGGMGGMERIGNVIYSQPQALTNISIAITQAVESIPKGKERVLIFDTLSTLMLYNEKKLIAKFMHFMTKKMREWNIKSVIFTLEQESDKAVLSEISAFCDTTVRIK